MHGAAGVAIVGAGPAGLACAACLTDRGVPAVVLEQADCVAPVWRRHYDRLHLHTHRRHSGLPGLPMPREFPTYPARDDMVAYLEDYARRFDIHPRFNTRVQHVRRDGGAWQVNTNSDRIAASAVIIASGIASYPFVPDWPGLDGFDGPAVHSSDYRNPAPFRGQRVLVVGFGNSGGEIALDLSEHGVQADISVRSPVNVIPRDILGMPVLSLSIAQSWLPYRVADLINRPIQRLLIGDLRRFGLPQSHKGPLAQITEDGRIPLLDIGTLDCIRSGAVQVRPGIERIDGQTVQFTDGSAGAFDALVLATGYRPDLRRMLPDCREVLTDTGAPRRSGGTSGYHGLYFCSFTPSPTGQLREIGIEARAIATRIARQAPP